MLHSLRMPIITLIIVAFGTLGFGADASAASKKKINKKVVAALEEFHDLVSGSEDLIEDAAGVLIFPSIKKGGLGIGGESGSGALQVDGITVGYYRTSSGSIGFQLGYQKRSQIMIFMTEAALKNFRISENWEVGADASVAIVTLDAGGGFDTETFDNPVIAFVYGASGLMYNLTLEGTKVSPIYPD